MRLSAIAVVTLALAAATSAGSAKRFNPMAKETTFSGKYEQKPDEFANICPIGEPVGGFKVVIGENRGECFVQGAALVTTATGVVAEEFKVTGTTLVTPLMSMCTYEVFGLTWFAKANMVTRNITFGISSYQRGTSNGVDKNIFNLNRFNDMGGTLLPNPPKDQLCTWTLDGSRSWFQSLQTFSGTFLLSKHMVGPMKFKRQTNGTYLLEGIMVDSGPGRDYGTSNYGGPGGDRFYPAAGSGAPVALVYSFRAFFTQEPNDNNEGSFGWDSYALVLKDYIYKELPNQVAVSEVIIDIATYTMDDQQLVVVETRGQQQISFMVYHKVASLDHENEYKVSQIDDSFGGQKVRDTNPKKRKRRRKNRRRRNSKKWLRRNFTTTAVP